MFEKRLSQLLKENKIKNTQLADRLGVSKSAVTKWIKGEAEPRPDILRSLALMFDVSVGYLINNEDKQPAPLVLKEKEADSYYFADIFPSVVYTQEMPDPIEKAVWLPIYETTISATPGIQDIVRDDIKGWHTAPESCLGAYGSDPFLRPFSMKVKGSSMLPFIRPGDYVTVRPAPFIVPDPSCIYAVKISDEETDTYGVVVKRVQIDEKRGLYVLRSDNPEFPAYIIESEKATIVGRIISVWRAL